MNLLPAMQNYEGLAPFEMDSGTGKRSARRRRVLSLKEGRFIVIRTRQIFRRTSASS